MDAVNVNIVIAIEMFFRCKQKQIWASNGVSQKF